MAWSVFIMPPYVNLKKPPRFGPLGPGPFWAGGGLPASGICSAARDEDRPPAKPDRHCSRAGEAGGRGTEAPIQKRGHRPQYLRDVYYLTHNPLRPMVFPAKSDFLSPVHPSCLVFKALNWRI